jgi:hypothetical protein
MASATWGEGATLAEGLHDWGRHAVPLLIYTLAFALQPRKSTENLSQFRRVVGEYSLRRLVRLFRDSLLSINVPRLHVGDSSQPLDGASAFHFAELRGSPH